MRTPLLLSLFVALTAVSCRYPNEFKNTSKNAPHALRVRRIIFLAGGCAPMMIVHGLLSLLKIYPLVSFLLGDFRQGVFLLWWLLGTGGLGILVYSSATYAPASRRLPIWQVLGLLTGILVAAPLIFSFPGEWWMSHSSALGASAAAYILITTGLGS